MMFPFLKPVAEFSSSPGEVAMAQWDAPSPTLLPRSLGHSFALLYLANRTRFNPSSKNEAWEVTADAPRDARRDEEDRSRRRRRHALGDTLLPLLRDKSGSPRTSGLLLQSWIGKSGDLPVGGWRTSHGGRRKACIRTSHSRP